MPSEDKVNKETNCQVETVSHYVYTPPLTIINIIS